MMIIHQADRDVVKWAIDQGYPYEYVREYGLPEPTLCIRMGLSRAFFRTGRLVHWRADAGAAHMDQLMYELSRLFGWCTVSKAYPRQKVFLTAVELAALRGPEPGAA